MQEHNLKVLDQLKPDEGEDQSQTYVYGLCSCGQPVQGGRTESDLRKHHDEHVANSR